MSQAGELSLVPPLYEDPLDLHRRNDERLTPELRAHLRAHDRLYFPAAADGASFALVLLPIGHHWWGETVPRRERERWSQMAAAVCGDRMLCVDLLPVLLQAPAGEVDRAFDDWHFGPKMNRRIAASAKSAVIDALIK